MQPSFALLALALVMAGGLPWMLGRRRGPTLTDGVCLLLALVVFWLGTRDLPPVSPAFLIGPGLLLWRGLRPPAAGPRAGYLAMPVTSVTSVTSLVPVAPAEGLDEEEVTQALEALALVARPEEAAAVGIQAWSESEAWN